ncbi:MAG: hypothetical protein ACR2P6_11495 [Gammaproteobacteria bacterium]
MRIVSGLVVSIALCSAVLAGAHSGDGAGTHKKLGQYSGFEGNEAALGAAVAKAILDVRPQAKADANLDFTDRELELGLAVSKSIKTLNSVSAYQHEFNDALVKMTLQFIQFAKNNDQLEQAAREDAMTQFPMLNRVAKMIEQSGNRELALIAITDQTTCFFQLTGEVERAPGKVTFRAPFGNVLTQTKRMGMHDLTEQEIHESWTVPHVKIWGEVMGVDLQISDWQDDGMVTISIPSATVAANH